MIRTVYTFGLVPTCWYPLFGVFAPFRAPNGAVKFLQVPQTPKTSKLRIAAAGGRTIGSRGRTKVAKRSPGSEEPKKSRKLSGGTELRPKKCSMRGWVGGG